MAGLRFAAPRSPRFASGFRRGGPGALAFGSAPTPRRCFAAMGRETSAEWRRAACGPPFSALRAQGPSGGRRPARAGVVVRAAAPAAGAAPVGLRPPGRARLRAPPWPPRAGERPGAWLPPPRSALKLGGGRAGSLARAWGPGVPAFAVAVFCRGSPLWGFLGPRPPSACNSAQARIRLAPACFAAALAVGRKRPLFSECDILWMGGVTLWPAIGAAPVSGVAWGLFLALRPPGPARGGATARSALVPWLPASLLTTERRRATIGSEVIFCE